MSDDTEILLIVRNPRCVLRDTGFGCIERHEQCIVAALRARPDVVLTALGFTSYESVRGTEAFRPKAAS